MKKVGMYLVNAVAFVLIMLAFACGTIAFAELGYSAFSAFIWGYTFAFFSMYLAFILHELGHAFCGYLTGYRLVALGLGSFLWTRKDGRFHFSKTAVLKNVGAQYVGIKEDESDQRMILMLSGGLLVHLSLVLVAILFGFLTQSWYFAGTWIFLNFSFLLANALPVGITDGAKIWELLQHPENVSYAYLGLRHSAQTLLAPDASDLKDFVVPIPVDARGSFAETILSLQGLVFLIDGKIEDSKETFQRILDQSENSMMQSLAQLYLLQLALLEDNLETAETYANLRGVKALLTMKVADMQLTQAWYQFKVVKDQVKTKKAIQLAKQKMNKSRMLRDEKSYYESWLAKLEKELAQGV